MYAELRRKQCSRCNEVKEEKEFYKIAGGKRPRPECKACTNLYHKKYRSTESGKLATKKARNKYQSSPDNILKDAQNKQEWARFKKYQITKSQFTQMLEVQKHQCLICGKSHNEGRGLVVDHCHDTGVVRGLLCDGCNRGLGFFKDKSQNLENAANYIKKFKK